MDIVLFVAIAFGIFYLPILLYRLVKWLVRKLRDLPDEQPTETEKNVNNVNIAFAGSLGSVLLFVGFVALYRFLVFSRAQTEFDPIFSGEALLLIFFGLPVLVASFIMWGVGSRGYSKAKQLQNIPADATGKLKAAGNLLWSYWVVVIVSILVWFATI